MDLLLALELGVFIAIHLDLEEESPRPWKDGEDDYRPGDSQKTVQLVEGVLESMPEVILQSVFIIRSANDEWLVQQEGTVFGLIILSIIASICSISNKYVWMDELMVIEPAQSLVFKQNHPIDYLSTEEMIVKYFSNISTWGAKALSVIISEKVQSSDWYYYNSVEQNAVSVANDDFAINWDPDATNPNSNDYQILRKIISRCHRTKETDPEFAWEFATFCD